MFFLTNHEENEAKKLVPDQFWKIQNCVYLWINSLKFHPVCFYCMSKSWTNKI